jgi:hypothetical protein
MDPVEHAARHYDILACEMEYENFVREKMEEQRQESINFIGTLVRQDLAEDFAKILASAYEYGCPVAEKISNAFGFNQKDFLAIEKNFEQFEQKIIQENNERYLSQYLD